MAVHTKPRPLSQTPPAAEPSGSAVAPPVQRLRSRSLFTLAEAEGALTYIERVVRDVTQTYTDVKRLRREMRMGTESGSVATGRAYQAAMDRLGELVDELDTVGVDLKDFEKGVVDFPSWHDGREVLLCWTLGEPRIARWHEVDAGRVGPRPVGMLRGAMEQMGLTRATSS